VSLTDMNRLVEEVLSEQRLLSSGKIRLIAGYLEPCQCDPALIRQVWVNLISNAVKYSSLRAESLIEIGSFPGDNEIIYMIKDNGVGFSMEYSGKLFGVFQRLHKMSDYPGTGVGLAIVKRVILKHGGRVWANAEQDKGATFYFSIPAIDSKNQTEHVI
jgi:two-component system sensor histidine kinase/response regulator